MKKLAVVFVFVFCLIFSYAPSAAYAHTVSVEIPGHMNNTDEIGINLGLDELTKPLDENLYYGRTLLTDDGKKAWDYVLQLLLDYDNTNDVYPRDSSGNTYIVVNYAEEAGVNPTVEDAKRIQSYLVRNEPRMFHLKDWGASYTTSAAGVETQKFYIGNGVQNGNDYHKKLLEIEPAVSNMLSCLKDDMTVYQQVRTLQAALESFVTYGFGGAESDIRGAFISQKAICGGYSKAFLYLMQRMGLNCIWVEGYTAPNGGGYHAWNYVEIFGKWYMVDTTWGGDNWFLQGQNYLSDGFAMHEHNMTFAVMPTLAENRIPANYGKYPSITLEAVEKAVVLKGAQYDASDLVLSYSSIYGEDLSKNINIVTQLDTSATGIYEVNISLSDGHENKVTKTSLVTVAEGNVVPQFEEYQTQYTLLQNGHEVAYDKGFLFKEYNNPPRIFAVPTQHDNNLFEARVGIIGSVRQNTQYGQYAGVKFVVEFLGDDQSTVLSSYETKRHGWKTESEIISIEVPKEACYVKISSVTFEGTGNNHSFWTDVKFTSYEDVENTQIIPALPKGEEPSSPDDGGKNNMLAVYIIAGIAVAVSATGIILHKVKK